MNKNQVLRYYVYAIFSYFFNIERYYVYEVSHQPVPFR